MKNRNIYPVQGEPYYGIYPGKNAENEPIIAFVGYEGIISALFDENANYLGYSEIVWTMPKIASAENSSDDYTEKKEQEFRIIRDKLLENGFTSFETVNVKKFWIDGFAIGITEYPAYLQEILDSETREFDDKDTTVLPEYNQVCLAVGYEMDQEEYDDLKESLEEWEKSGDFVLYFGNDYHCDDTGYIHSS